MEISQKAGHDDAHEVLLLKWSYQQKIPSQDNNIQGAGGKLLTIGVKASYKGREADEMQLQQERNVMDEVYWLR
jgi:hypothetical protein